MTSHVIAAADAELVVLRSRLAATEAQLHDLQKTQAIAVLNDYPAGAVPALNAGRLWTMLWQYAQVHTDVWRVIDVQTGNFIANLSANAVTAKNLFNGTGDMWLAESGCADGGDPAAGLDGPAWTDDAGEGYRYNHATFNDLVLSGAAGLQPHANGTLVVNPLLSGGDDDSLLSWWAVDGVALHG